MARSRRRSSSSQRLPESESAFRSRVEAQLVDQLLHRFATLVKHGLELMLETPSERARQVFRQRPELMDYGPTDIPVLVAWAAQGAYEMIRSDFCQHVLTHPEWQLLLEVQTQADLDHLATGFADVQARLIELAIHDALKGGDKQDSRPEGQEAAVRDEFAESIGASQVIKLLKKRLVRLVRLKQHRKVLGKSGEVYAITQAHSLCYQTRLQQLCIQVGATRLTTWSTPTPQAMGRQHHLTASDWTSNVGVQR